MAPVCFSIWLMCPFIRVKCVGVPALRYVRATMVNRLGVVTDIRWTDPSSITTVCVMALVSNLQTNEHNVCGVVRNISFHICSCIVSGIVDVRNSCNNCGAFVGSSWGMMLSTVCQIDHHVLSKLAGTERHGGTRQVEQ